MKKMNIAMPILLVVLSVGICFGAYRLYYVPTAAETEKVQATIAERQAQYDRYQKAQKSDVPKKETTYPTDIREQDQLMFIQGLERELHFEATTVRFTDKSKAHDNGLMSKKLTFSYRLGSYGDFVKMLHLIRENKEYPSAVEDFTIRRTTEGVFYGEMHVRNYYASSKSAAYTFEAPAVPTGNAGFLRQTAPNQ